MEPPTQKGLFRGFPCVAGRLLFDRIEEIRRPSRKEQAQRSQ